MLKSKVCSKCREDKHLSHFPKNKSFKDGYAYQCSTCKNTHRNKKRKDNPKDTIIERSKYRAMKRGLEFNLSVDDIALPSYCPILGIELTYDGDIDSSASIDRIDASKGYVKGNVAIISNRANRIKNDGTAEEHELIARWMKDNG